MSFESITPLQARVSIELTFYGGEILELKGAIALLKTCAQVKKDETILIVTDTNKYEIAKTLADVAISSGFDASIAVMKPRKAHAEDPPRPIISAMRNSDVIFSPTTFSLFHSCARRDAVQNGARFVNMADYSLDMLKEGALTADFIALKELVFKVSDVLTKGSAVRVTTALGTNIRMDISGRDAFPQTGMSIKPGESSSPPNIETCVAPIEGTAEGRILVDGSIPQPRIGLIDEPIELIVRKGFIKEIIGTGSKVEQLRKIMKGSVGNPNNYNIGELGIGLNPKASFSGKMLEDEGVYGSVHFGLGDNYSFPGGHTRAEVHIDAIVKKPTVFIDDVLLLKDGEIMI